MLPQQLARDAVKNLGNSYVPLEPLYDRWINIKRRFRKHYKDRNSRGMDGMLRRLGMTLEGKHHSGIDDCRNIAKIVQRMQKDGWKPTESDLS